MTKANATETDILAKIFTATALPWDAATDLDIHLHVGDPGEAGTSATSPATYTSYAPVTVSRSASYPPGVWMLARQAGGMGSFGRIDGEGALTASGALGVAAVAELSGVGDLSVSGQLIVSAVASLSGSGALTGDVLAVLQLAADLSGSGDVAGTLVALGNAVSAITGAGALTAVP